MGIYIDGIEMPKDDGRLSIDIFPNGKVCINLDLECKQIATAISIPASTLKDTISRQVAIDAFDGAKAPEEYCSEYQIGYDDGIDFAINTLSVLPPASIID